MHLVMCKRPCAVKLRVCSALQYDRLITNDLHKNYKVSVVFKTAINYWSVKLLKMLSTILTKGR